MAEEVLLGAQTDAEVALLLARTLVFDGIGADEFDGRLEAAIDAVIVGIELDRFLLPGADEGDVGGTDLRLDKQRILDGNDLHQVLPGLDDTADGADLDLLDRATQG